MKYIIIAMLCLAPMTAFAAEGENGGFPWGTIITIAFGIIAALASTALLKFKIALKASYQAMKVLSDALKDSKLDDEEIKAIVTSFSGGAVKWGDFIKALLDLFKKKEE